MNTILDFNPAISGKLLLEPNDKSKLRLDSKSFSHLISYINLAKDLKKEFSNSSNNWSAATNAISKNIEDFGSNKTLLNALSQNPDVLLTGTKSKYIYVEIASVIQHLEQTSSSFLANLATLETIDKGKITPEIIAELLGSGLNKKVQKVNDLINSLTAMKKAFITSNVKLEIIFDAQSKSLSKMNEDIGGLQFTVQNTKEKIENLNFLQKQKKKELEALLTETQKELDDKLKNQGKLRNEVRKFEDLITESAWLRSGFDNIMEFCQNIKEIWLAFDSKKSQMTVFSVNGEVQQPKSSWFDKAIRLDEVISQWKSVNHASKNLITKFLQKQP